MAVVRRLEKEGVSHGYARIGSPLALGQTVPAGEGLYYPVADLDQRLVNPIMIAVRPTQDQITVTEPLKPEGDEKEKNKEDKDE